MRGSTVIIVIAAAAVWFYGCGTDPDKPVYNTNKNPDNLPQAACEVLDGIDQGTLDSYMHISNALTKLYLDHPDLLDNEDWKGIVDRLGAKFLHWARRHEAQGIPGYTRAAWYYMLASQANLSDTVAAGGAERFESWFEIERTNRGLVDSAVAPGAPLPLRLKLLRNFVFADSSRREFANRMLASELDSIKMLDSARIVELTLPDQAFVAFLSGAPLGRVPVMLRFAEPPVDLITMVTRVDSRGRCRAEFYFVARETTDRSYWLSLVVNGDSQTPLPSDTLAEGSQVFAPRNPTFAWKPGIVEAASLLFDCGEGPESLALALFTQTQDGAVMARPEGRDAPYVPLATGGERP